MTSRCLRYHKQFNSSLHDQVAQNLNKLFFSASQDLSKHITETFVVINPNKIMMNIKTFLREVFSSLSN